MTHDCGRYVLLSLLLGPACVGRTTQNDEGGDPEPQRELGEGCRAFFDLYEACYEPYYESESEGYDPGSYCDYVTTYLVDEYGEDCARAQDDVFACLAELECEALGDTEIALACPAEFDHGREVCPELFPGCLCLESQGDDDSCSMECSDCIDGNDYAVECHTVLPEGTATCVCFVNGEVEQTIRDLEFACLDLTTIAGGRCMIPL